METIADIVREMRDDVITSRANNPDPWARIFLSASNRAIGEYADRIEAAHNREIIVERNLSNDHILSLHDEIAAKDAENNRLREIVKELADPLDEYFDDDRIRALVARAREMIGGAK